MKERPILFNAEMVRAVLDGRKTQTRRVIKPQPWEWVESVAYNEYLGEWQGHGYEDGMMTGTANATPQCPYGKPGDELWVRETFFAWGNWERYYDAAPNKFRNRFVDNTDDEHPIKYRATDGRPNHDFYGGPSNGGDDYHKRPSLFMPRWASRIQLRITDVRVERVQEIIKEDSLAEGIERTDCKFTCEPYRNYEHHKMAPGYNKSDARCSFMTLWNSINEERGCGWDKNPWVWVVEFEVKP